MKRCFSLLANNPRSTRACLTSLSMMQAVLTPRRYQSQSSVRTGLPFDDGEVDPRHTTAKNMRKLNPETMPHYVRSAIQNDRREMGLGEVVDWSEFAQDAIYIPTRSGPLWVGKDDPRAQRLVRRKEKMKKQPLQKSRRKPGPDMAKELENHPLREYFTTATNLQDPLSVANNLHRAGLLKEYDIKHTASRINYVPRPPVVSIMGHVDHGKTTLLDYLRRTNVASGEAGGITQNVGAFTVKTPSNKTITFIDTPGHAAFTSMREVGASANDMIIMVVSAADGVQPQTKEVIEIANRSGTPMIVAITKIDRQPKCDFIKDQLRECGIELEEDGGDVQLVKICARDGTGIPELLDALDLQGELCEISTPEPSRAELTVIESRRTDTHEIAAVVRCGTVKPRQVFVAGIVFGVVKKVLNEFGETVEGAGPSTPVILQGFTAHPKPGSVLLQVSSEQHAQKYYYFMNEVFKTEGGRESYLQLMNQEQKGNLYNRKPDNNLIRSYSTKPYVIACRAATFGMLQAMMKMIYDLPRLDGVSMEIKITEVGGLRDYDVALMGGSGQPTCIMVFGNTVDENILDIPSHVVVHRFNVLYHGIEMLKETLVRALPKISKTRVMAVAECLQTFKASQSGKTGNAGGMRVIKGTLVASHLTFRVYRKKTSFLKKMTNDTTAEEERELVYDGQMKELRRFKDLVPSVEEGLECGVILFDEFSFRVGDILEQYEVYEEERDVAEEYEAAEKREKAIREQAEREDAEAAIDPVDETKAQEEALLEKLKSMPGH
ncbi:translation initiation factor IF-2 [Angomonas deanei]|nr:translation initiation factor IF-2 [Angomonas deanei]|eukprot:EPY34443.1 translation initiation factor IF-2 [Angomonas deanei]